MTSPTDDSDHLRLLSLFHYIVAALAALCALFPLVHLALGLAMLTGHFGGSTSFSRAGDTEVVTSIMGWFFVIFASGWIVCGLTFAVCLAFAGRSLNQRRRHRYCLVLAGLACMFMPFGTVLGVFTIIVLMRPSVKASFEATDLVARTRGP